MWDSISLFFFFDGRPFRICRAGALRRCEPFPRRNGPRFGSTGPARIAINWGIWERTRTASAEARRSFQEAGLLSMSADEALDALGRLLAGPAPQGIVARIDWSLYKPLFELRRSRPFLSLVGTISPPVAVGKAPVVALEAESLAERLAQTPVHMHGAVVEDFVRKEVAAVLRLAADDPVPPETGFFDLGMDSLMLVELRRRLERWSGLSLPSSVTFSYPNLQVMSDFLASELRKPSGTKDSTEVGAVPRPSRQPCSTI